MNLKNFINSEYVNPVDDKWIENVNPSNGEVYGKIPRSNQADLNNAIESSEKAFKEWSNSSFEFRSKILIKISELLIENLDEFAKAESFDNGKPISLATKIDIPRAASNFRFFGNAITQFFSESHESIGSNAINFTLRNPLGIVGCISPWNLPLYLFTWKIAPAIAAGNCVIAKPSEITPVTSAMLGNICNKSGLPKGVLNIVHGYGHEIGQNIVESKFTKAISFTGGTKTGEIIAKTAAPMFKKLSLELGGKNPNIIFSDCDYSKMLDTTVRSSFSNQGQICLCGSRIYVQKEIYNKFKEDFIIKTKNLKIGDPSNEKTEIGALVSKDHLEKVKSYIDEAEKNGGKIICGGKKVKVAGEKNGFFLEPTIIELNTNDCKINKEEIFGPVVTILPFENEEEILKYANDSVYGLSATIWTQNINRAIRLSKNIEAGIVWINTWMMRDLRTPFGGVKSSGVGREGGFEALKFFTEQKNICIEYD